jgi:hypothetical protein
MERTEQHKATTRNMTDHNKKEWDKLDWNENTKAKGAAYKGEIRRVFDKRHTGDEATQQQGVRRKPRRGAVERCQETCPRIRTYANILKSGKWHSKEQSRRVGEDGRTKKTIKEERRRTERVTTDMERKRCVRAAGEAAGQIITSHRGKDVADPGTTASRKAVAEWLQKCRQIGWKLKMILERTCKGIGKTTRTRASRTTQAPAGRRSARHLQQPKIKRLTGMYNSLKGWSIGLFIMIIGGLMGVRGEEVVEGRGLKGTYQSPIISRLQEGWKGNPRGGKDRGKGTEHGRGTETPLQEIQTWRNKEGPDQEAKEINSHKELIFRICNAQSWNRDQVILQWNQGEGKTETGTVIGQRPTAISRGTTVRRDVKISESNEQRVIQGIRVEQAQTIRVREGAQVQFQCCAKAGKSGWSSLRFQNRANMSWETWAVRDIVRTDNIRPRETGKLKIVEEIQGTETCYLYNIANITQEEGGIFICESQGEQNQVKTELIKVEVFTNKFRKHLIIEDTGECTIYRFENIQLFMSGRYQWIVGSEQRVIKEVYLQVTPSMCDRIKCWDFTNGDYRGGPWIEGQDNETAENEDINGHYKDGPGSPHSQKAVSAAERQYVSIAVVCSCLLIAMIRGRGHKEGLWWKLVGIALLGEQARARNTRGRISAMLCLKEHRQSSYNIHSYAPNSGACMDFACLEKKILEYLVMNDLITKGYSVPSVFDTRQFGQLLRVKDHSVVSYRCDVVTVVMAETNEAECYEFPRVIYKNLTFFFNPLVRILVKDASKCESRPGDAVFDDFNRVRIINKAVSLAGLKSVIPKINFASLFNSKALDEIIHSKNLMLEGSTTLGHIHDFLERYEVRIILGVTFLYVLFVVGGFLTAKLVGVGTFKSLSLVSTSAKWVYDFSQAYTKIVQKKAYRTQVARQKELSKQATQSRTLVRDTIKALNRSEGSRGRGSKETRDEKVREGGERGRIPPWEPEGTIHTEYYGDV